MGRITIFSSNDCPHCEKAKNALQARNIPYTEINLSSYPQKRSDMLGLADHLAVPQVFFNEQHIGDADDTIAVLQQWEQQSSQNGVALYDCYNHFIVNQPDPKDRRLSPLHATPPYIEKEPPPGDIGEGIPMPDGSVATVLKLMQKLQEILPKQDLKYNLTVYRNCFRAVDAIAAFRKHYDHFLKTDEDAVAFGSRLVQAKIMHHVCDQHDFKNENLYYRLQCFHQPSILNSYRVWTGRVDSNPMAILKRLFRLLTRIETDMKVANNDNDDENDDNVLVVNYQNAPKHVQYPLLEEAVCELQGVDLTLVDDHEDTKLAFGLNLYNIMIRYALMKLGVGMDPVSRIAFFSGVQTNVGGLLFSFYDLENGFLRSNRRGPRAPGCVSSPALPFGKGDPRLAVMRKGVDCRIHFGLHRTSNVSSHYFFSPHSVKEELRIMAMEFCDKDNHVRLQENGSSTRTLFLSPIFNWYSLDFAEPRDCLPEAVVHFLRGEKKNRLQKWINEALYQPMKIKFAEFDWGVSNNHHIMTFQASCLRPNFKTIRALV